MSMKLTSALYALLRAWESLYHAWLCQWWNGLKRFITDRSEVSMSSVELFLLLAVLYLAWTGDKAEKRLNERINELREMLEERG